MSRTSFSSNGSTSSVALDIVRDPGVCGEWLNRFCVDAETHKQLYYVDVSDDSKLEIHRGNKYGPIVAKTLRCRSNPGATDLHLAGGNGQHIHYDERTGRASFVLNGQTFNWNQRGQLTDKNGGVLAELSKGKKDSRQLNNGRLTIYQDGIVSQQLTDPIVLSALFFQERSDENSSWF